MFYAKEIPKEVDINSFSVYAFDKDNTITPANEAIGDTLLDELIAIMRRKYVVILTARNMQTCEEHIVTPLRNHIQSRIFDVIAQNLVFGCSNGSEIYTYSPGTKEFTRVVNGTLPGSLANKKEFEKLIPEMATILGVPASGMSFEQRSPTMWAFVCIPRNASNEERKEFDPTRNKRQSAIDSIYAKLPPLESWKNYEILPAGSTSIDIALHDKKAWMENLIRLLGYEPKQNEVIFFGDWFDWGNDTPVQWIETITVVHVENPENTQEILKNFKKPDIIANYIS